MSLGRDEVCFTRCNWEQAERMLAEAEEKYPTPRCPVCGRELELRNNTSECYCRKCNYWFDEIPEEDPEAERIPGPVKAARTRPRGLSPEPEDSDLIDPDSAHPGCRCGNRAEE